MWELIPLTICFYKYELKVYTWTSIANHQYFVLQNAMLHYQDWQPWVWIISWVSKQLCSLHFQKLFVIYLNFFHLQDNWPSELNSNTLSTTTRRLGIHVGVPNSSSIRWFKSTTHLWRQQRNHEGTDCPNHCLWQVNQTNL